MKKLIVVSTREVSGNVLPVREADEFFTPGEIVAVHGAASDIAKFGFVFVTRAASDGNAIYLTAESASLLKNRIEAAVLPNIFFGNCPDFNLNFRANVAEVKTLVDQHDLHTVVLDCRYVDFGLDSPSLNGGVDLEF